MKYIVDHDYHIHSSISPCSSDALRTPDNILKQATDANFKRIVITDHFWDLDLDADCGVWTMVPFEKLASALPLPQNDKCKFYFGCECDMNRQHEIGILPDKFDKFDFIIVSTTHFHLWYNNEISVDDIEKRAELYVERLFKLLYSNLPDKKVGIAHLTTSLISKPENHLDIIDLISDEVFAEIFKLAAKRGWGVELNIKLDMYKEAELPRVLRPYKIAKECGCKFYFGSDAHTMADFDGKVEIFNKIVDLLDLEESDKYLIP